MSLLRLRQFQESLDVLLHCPFWEMCEEASGGGSMLMLRFFCRYWCSCMDGIYHVVGIL